MYTCVAGNGYDEVRSSAQFLLPPVDKREYPRVIWVFLVLIVLSSKICENDNVYKKIGGATRINNVSTSGTCFIMFRLFTTYYGRLPRAGCMG